MIELFRKLLSEKKYIDLYKQGISFEEISAMFPEDIRANTIIRLRRNYTNPLREKLRPYEAERRKRMNMYFLARKSNHKPIKAKKCISYAEYLAKSGQKLDAYTKNIHKGG